VAILDIDPFDWRDGQAREIDAGGGLADHRHQDAGGQRFDNWRKCRPYDYANGKIRRVASYCEFFEFLPHNFFPLSQYGLMG